MNQRLKRKIEKRRRQQICEALDLCLQINGLQKSKREITGDHPTVFCNFSGHVACLRIEIYVRGWKTREDPDKTLMGRITCPDELDQMIHELKELKKDLHSCSCGRSRK